MAYRCHLCNKKRQEGKSHTHHTGVAGGQWKKRATKTLRSFKPNLHWITMPVSGVMVRVHACTRCIKRVRFDAAKQKAAAAPVATA